VPHVHTLHENVSGGMSATIYEPSLSVAITARLYILGNPIMSFTI